MHDELTGQRAISLRLAGRSVNYICSALGRVKAWFHKWWGRYLQAGPEGLYDLTRANHHVAQRVSPELERTILSIRRRVQAHASPATRDSLTGATAIRAELKSLEIRPLPCERTIERILERNGLTVPRVRLAPLLPRQEWPGPQARASNQLHEVDSVGPIYLKGCSHRYYIWVGKDAFDGAVCLRLAGSRRMEMLPLVPRRVLEGLGPAGAGPVRRELAGWGPAVRTPSRVIRLCLLRRQPRSSRQGNRSSTAVWGTSTAGSRNRCSNGASSDRADLRRELARLQEAVNTQHVHPRLGGQTPAQHRSGLRLQKLPASFEAPTGRRKLAAGRVTFIRRVSAAGTVTVLSQSFRVGK